MTHNIQNTLLISGERGIALNKTAWKSKIGFKLFIVTFIALLISITFFILFYEIATTGLYYYFDKTVYIEQRFDNLADNFQTFVTKNNLSTNDTQEITDWTNRQLLNISLYKNNTLIYDSLMPDMKPYELDIISDTEIKSYLIHFSNETVSMVMNGFLEYPFYIMTFILGLILSFILFFMIVIKAISKRIAYIKLIDEEIQILGGGELSYPITQKGTDELASLASNLEEMRKSMIERLSIEEDIRKEKEELVTSMSHDLRTPLTTQIGYLEIINQKKYKSKAQKDIYIHKILEKAYQMKRLSDNLFESFLQTKDTKSIDFNLLDPIAPANQTLMELLGDMVLYLTEQGFHIKKTGTSKNCMVQISMEGMSRIFDNILSNLLKYASKDNPIFIDIYQKDNFFIIEISNTIRKFPPETESNKIGLSNMKDIIKSMNGTLFTKQTETTYQVNLHIPIILTS